MDVVLLFRQVVHVLDVFKDTFQSTSKIVKTVMSVVEKLDLGISGSCHVQKFDRVLGIVCRERVINHGLIIVSLERLEHGISLLVWQFRHRRLIKHGGGVWLLGLFRFDERAIGRVARLGIVVNIRRRS
ncbi:hypothetical protein OGAPHI_000655 [Ogataea philodendri]|uniref:Uncharacterized protein n=1 Tax=Ogataea philodendri TaxID=1378263 RepID=A0A9P8PGC9_9ASCO|nr:uncharacterized protein OGAPHI_000655 [Ogataea philodendri]KAH3670944.1 hypothetical protein OGAPHI_000655 [Ogataea philodendri]